MDDRKDFISHNYSYTYLNEFVDVDQSPFSVCAHCQPYYKNVIVFLC